MSMMSIRKKQLFPFLLLIFIFAPIFVTPLRLFSTSSTTEAGNDSVSSQYVVSRIGLDGPLPREVMYAPMDAIGTYNLIVILVEFTDKTHTFSSTEVETNSIPELDAYYDEVSYGAVAIDGDTTAWLDLGQARSYYVEGTSHPSDPKFELVEDAIDAADPYVNFNAYDGVTIIHAGQGQELSHDWQDYWSSEWTSFTIVTDDGASITRASVSPEESYPGDLSHIGTLAHEFGHDLGLPDLYDVTPAEEHFVDHWGLMAAGSWNGPLGLGDQPSHMMGWCKTELGWVNGSRLVEVASEITTLIDPLELSTTDVHLLKIPVTTDQYFLIEVRRKIGYDTSLPFSGAGGEGVVVTFIDETLDSGHGIVKVIDSHPLTPTKDDGAFGIGVGEVDSYVSSVGQFSMVVEGEVGQAYNVSVIRAFMEFLNPLDGAVFLTPNVTIEWTGTAAGPGIDHFELLIDGTLSYSGIGTTYDAIGLSAGAHNATLIMELAGTGRRLSIQSRFFVDLAAPVIHSVSHLPEVAGFGDSIIINLEATDDTWIVNATVFFQRQGDATWYRVEMTFVTGTQWRGLLGTFHPLDYLGQMSVQYYVTVTDAANRTTTNDNSGTYYSIPLSGMGTIVWVILGAAVILVVVLFVCWRLQRRRRQEVPEYTPTQDAPTYSPSPSNYPPPPPEQTQPLTGPIRSGFCYHCGAPLTPNAIFCGHCGKPTS
jgi:M6 family metalloprotease-like protein